MMPDAPDLAPDPPRRARLLALRAAALSLLAIGVAARFCALSRQSVWYDEANGVRIAQRSLGEILLELRADASPPLYYVFMHVWTRLFGISPAAIRAPSALFGALALPVLFLAARRCWGRGAAVACLGIAVLSQMHLYYCQEARMYTLLVLFNLLALFSLREALREGRKEWWAGYVLASVLAAYTHNYGVFAAIGTATAAGVAVRTRRDRRKPLALSLAAIALGYLPWLPFVLRHQIAGTAIQGNWLPPFNLNMIPKTFAHFCGMQMFRPSSVLFWIGYPAFILCLGSALVEIEKDEAGSRRLRPRSDPDVRLAGLFVLVSLGLPLAISTVRPIYLPERYSIAAWPGFVLLVGYGWSRLRTPGLRTAVAVAIAAVSAAAFLWHFSYLRKAPDRDVADFLRNRVGKQDLVVFSPHWTAVSIAYYIGPLPNQLGYPMRTLQERQWKNEALEREHRSLDEMVALTVNRANALGGRVFFLRMPWLKESADLKTKYGTNLKRIEEISADGLELTIYETDTSREREYP